MGVAISTGAVNADEQSWAGRKTLTADAITALGALSGNVTLNTSYTRNITADANGSDRTFTLPSWDAVGLTYFIYNIGVANNLLIKDSNAVLKATIQPGQFGILIASGTDWPSGIVLAGVSLAGQLMSDGSVVGATAQAQTFTDGVVLDAITGNTTNMTITGKAGSSSVGLNVSATGGAGNGAFAGGAFLGKGGAGGAGGAGGSATIQGGIPASGNGAGGDALVTGGAGSGSGAGGANTQVAGAGGATGAGGAWAATAGRGGSTSGAAGTWTGTAGAGGAATTTTGGLAKVVGGASGTGATGNGGKFQGIGGAAASTAGTGGAAEVTGGLGTTTGAGGAATITGGVGGASGSGGAATLTGGASAGASGTAGAATVDAGAATGGTGAAVNIGTTNATAVNIALASVATVFGGPITDSVGASTAAAGTGVIGDAGALPAGTAALYPTTAADGTKAVKIHANDKVTGRRVSIGNGVSNQVLKVFAPSGGNINGLGADTAFSTASGKGCTVWCLSSAGNTWLAQ